MPDDFGLTQAELEFTGWKDADGVDSKEARRSLSIVLHDLARLRLDRLNAA